MDTRAGAGASGSHLVGWGGACATAASTCVLDLTADEAVSARFAASASVSPAAPTIRRLRLSAGSVRLELTQPARGFRLECALRRQAKGHIHQPAPAFAGCASAITYRHLRRGDYSFYWRVVGTDGTASPVLTRSIAIR
jgi:hypothetical protein